MPSPSSPRFEPERACNVDAPCVLPPPSPPRMNHGAPRRRWLWLPGRVCARGFLFLPPFLFSDRRSLQPRHRPQPSQRQWRAAGRSSRWSSALPCSCLPSGVRWPASGLESSPGNETGDQGEDFGFLCRRVTRSRYHGYCHDAVIARALSPAGFICP